MPTTIATSPLDGNGNLVTGVVPPSTVQTKTLLVDDGEEPEEWEDQPRLRADRITLKAGTYSTARISREHSGLGFREYSSDTNEIDTSADLVGKFVRIEVDHVGAGTPIADENLVFVGYVLKEEKIESQRKPAGSDPADNPVGRQFFTVVGLEYFLSVQPLSYSAVEDNSPGANPDAITRINRALTFNDGSNALGSDDNRGRGNRNTTQRKIEDLATSGHLTDTTYVFHDGKDATTPQKWKASEIIDYLLGRFCPRDSNRDDAPCPYRLASGAGAINPLISTVKAEGKTIFQIIQEISNPRRGSSFYAEFDETDQQVKFHFFSLSSVDVALPSGSSIPANQNIIDIDTDSDMTLGEVQIKPSEGQRYDRFRARGARATSTITLGVEDGTLEKDWTTEKQTSYLAGASSETGYSALSDEEKRRANDAARSEPRHERVFAGFKVPDDWDQETGDGGTAVKATALPELTESGGVSGPAPSHQPKMRILTETRLAKLDQDTGKIEYEAPMAFLKDKDDRWRLAEKMSESGSDSPIASYSLSLGSSGLNLRLISQAGVGHTLAGSDWTGASPSNVEQEVDYQDLRVTVTVEYDYWSEAVYDVAGTVVGKPKRELIIPMGNDYRLDYIAANTVKGVVGGALDKQASGEVLRDDFEALQAIARMVGQWYQLSRKTVNLPWKQPIAKIYLGQYIRDLGVVKPVSIFSAVGVVDHDLVRGTTRVRTLAQGINERAVFS